VSRWLILAAALVIGLPALLPAQYRDPYGRQRANVQPVAIKGAIQNIARGVIVVLDANTQVPWRIAILPATEVQVTGAVTADSLRSGVIVEFIAEIDGRGAIREKVDELTVTSLGPQKQMGLFPPEEAGTGELQGGFGGEKGNGSNAKGGKTEKRAGRPRGKGAMTPGRYRIVGRLLAGHDGALSVQVPGRGTLAFALADDPSVKVDMTDFSAVKQGSEATVKAVMMPNRPGLAQALQVKVTLPEPPGGAKKKPAAKPDDKHPPESPKKGKDKDAGLPQPAPG
jgi:hypothetical protein